MKIITLSLLLVFFAQCALAESLLFQTTGDPNNFGQLPKGKAHLSFPQFSTVSIVKEGGGDKALLEGVIVNPASGEPLQGVKVYTGYGFLAPQLRAISDRNGKVSMVIDLNLLFQHPTRIKGLPEQKVPLCCIYIGDPFTRGKLSRYYNIDDDAKIERENKTQKTNL